jgi:hypothetical protein
MRTNVPLCPRCGYDQSGEIAAWERGEHPACPLEGRCTECALEFRWCDLLNPRLAGRSRFFEVAEWGLAGSAVRTALRTLRPRSFWAWVRMEHPIAPRRLALLVLVATACTYAAMVLIATVLGVAIGFRSRGMLSLSYGWWDRVSPVDDLLRWFQYAAWPLRTRYDWISGARGVHPLPVIALLAAALMPATFLLLPQSLRRAKVRRIHLVRAGAYSLIMFPIVLLTPNFAVIVLNSLRGAWGIFFPFGVQLWSLRHHEALACSGALADVCLWLLLWWSAVLRRYLRLPHSWAVALAMLVLALVLAVTVIVIGGGGVWLLTGIDVV